MSIYRGLSRLSLYVKGRVFHLWFVGCGVNYPVVMRSLACLGLVGLLCISRCLSVTVFDNHLLGALTSQPQHTQSLENIVSFPVFCFNVNISYCTLMYIME